MATRDIVALLNKGLTKAYDFMGQTHVPVGRKFFEYIPTSSGYDIYQHFNPYGTLPQPRGFGQGIAEASLTQGFGKTYVQVMLGLKDVVANELIKRDEYGMLTRWCTARGGALAEIYQTNDEISAAHVFKAGFATVTPAPGSPDGQPLFSLNHPISPQNNTVWANMPSTTMPFGMPALQAARANLETQQKANGLTKWNNKPKRIGYHPNIEEIVLQCLHSEWVPGTADLNMNTMKGRDIEPVSWAYWEVSGATNPTAFNSWFVQGEIHYCKWIVLTPVEFKSQEILGINSTMFASFQEQVLGFDSPWGMYGSLST